MDAFDPGSLKLASIKLRETERTNDFISPLKNTIEKLI